MFRNPAFYALLKSLPNSPVTKEEDMFAVHPLVLSEALEFAFANLDGETFYRDVYRKDGRNATLDHAILARASDLFTQQASMVRFPEKNDRVADDETTPRPDTENMKCKFGAIHLIYAFLIENTKTIEVFRRVVEEIVRGETLDIPSFDGRLWARAAEELFFAQPRAHSILRTESELRESADAVRRNAYYRLLGLELNTGAEARKVPFHKPKAANTEFIDTFQRFLNAVWIGYSNRANTSGSNPTDFAGIAQLVRRLRAMLRNRRRAGALMREEYQAVCMASYFHATLMDNTPIITDLRCEAESPEGRLKRIGDRIGMPVHARAEYYFAMADSASQILLDIETDETLDQDANLRSFFEEPDGTLPTQIVTLRRARLEDVQTVTTNWSLATGQNLRVQTSKIAA